MVCGVWGVEAVKQCLCDERVPEECQKTIIFLFNTGYPPFISCQAHCYIVIDICQPYEPYEP